jgi:hypothetical protein
LGKFEEDKGKRKMLKTLMVSVCCNTGPCIHLCSRWTITITDGSLWFTTTQYVSLPALHEEANDI